MDAGLQALFWFLLKKRTRNSRLTASAIRQRSSSEKMYRIRRKTRLTVPLPLYRTSQSKGASGKFQEQAPGLILHTALTLTISGMLGFECRRILSSFFF